MTGIHASSSGLLVDDPEGKRRDLSRCRQPGDFFITSQLTGLAANAARMYGHPYWSDRFGETYPGDCHSKIGAGAAEPARLL